MLIRSAVEKPTLSVIVAIYNMEENGYLADCLASFDAQDCEPGHVEYVLADDCSTDGSLAVAQAWAESRNDATIIHLHKNMRQGAARNRAIDEARGRWFSIVDADDAVSPDYASWILAAAAETGADAIVTKWIQRTDEHMNLTGERKRNLQSPGATGVLDDEKMRKLILKHWQFGVWPRWLFNDDQNRFLEGMSYEDTPVGIRWRLQLESVAEAGGGTYFYRQNPNSITHTTGKDIQKLEDRLASSIAILDLAKSLGGGVYERFKDELDFYFVQVGLFNTLYMVSGNEISRDYVYRLCATIRGRVDFLANPYFKSSKLLPRCVMWLKWEMPWVYLFLAKAYGVLRGA